MEALPSILEPPSWTDEETVTPNGKKHIIRNKLVSLVDLKWIWNVLLFTLAIVFCWLVFGGVWWAITVGYGDHLHTISKNSTHIPCVQNIRSFSSAFLFSVETQHTIGYGYRYITKKCPEASVILVIQSLLAVIIHGVLAAVVYSKLTDSKNRTRTILFSKNLIVQENKKIIFRVGDIGDPRLIQVKIGAELWTSSGMQHVEFLFEKGENRVSSLIWPMTACHVIDDVSPFRRLDWSAKDWKLTTHLEGFIESSGLVIRARRVFKSADICWNREFELCVFAKKGKYEFDCRKFNSTSTEMTGSCNYPADLKPSSAKNRRVIDENGEPNVSFRHVQSSRYMADLFTTLLRIKWRWNLLVMSAGFVLSWFAFGVVWWIIAFLHGDLNGDLDCEPCVRGIQDLITAFYFSMESMHTIGYGSRYITEECPTAIFLLCLQSLVGVLFQSSLVGISVAKFFRPNKKCQTLKFSQHAVIYQAENNKLRLELRVCCDRTKEILHPRASVQLIRANGRAIEVENVCVQTDRIWPMTVSHVIDDLSPLYGLSQKVDKFELVVSVVGYSSGMKTISRVSYLERQVLLGRKFEEIKILFTENGEYTLDFTKFEKTVKTPLEEEQIK